MASNSPQYIGKQSQEGLIQYHRQTSTIVQRQWNLREQMRQIDMAYLREQDYTAENWKARISNNAGDANKIQNITVPVIKPQINSAVAYQAAVFLGEYPIFPVNSSPGNESAAKQMQAIFEENSIRMGWLREFLLFFYDGFKYNLSAMEVCWEKVTTAAIETDISYKGGVEGKPKEIIWAGNRVKRWDPYNVYFDTRVVPYDIPSKGEFAGHTELMSRTALKTFINSLETRLEANIQPAFESPSLLNVGDSGNWGASYYLPRLNPGALVDPASMQSTDWMSWSGLASTSATGLSINYRGLYEVSTEYVRIIPKDFDIRVPSAGTPQVWKLIIVNHSVVIYAERQTNAHEKIPVFFGQPAEDGLGYQTKSLATDALPFQQTASALMNSVLASRRRAVTDRVLYDPSRILEAHINNPNPSAKIPVRPSAYGKNVAESVYQFPFRDDQAQIALGEIQGLVQFSNVLAGQNQARQGQFVKGNKTDGQWDQTMSSATSKDQLTALLYEVQVFTPMKEVLKINTLQYQGAGTVYSPSQKQEVQIDPLELRKAVLNFKVTDGYLPEDKVMSTDTLKVAMQVLGSSPQLAGAYNIGPLFSYIMETENADLEPFEKSPQQIAYEQAMGQWSQMAQLAIQKGAPFNVPQPLPQQYGYNPQMSDPEEAGEPASGDESTNQPTQRVSNGNPLPQ